MTTSIDLTPNPRILQVIAEVDLRVEQCLAELIDNCFDELRKAREEEPTIERRIDVTLPTPKQVNSKAVISVADSGRGMDLEQMRAAMRAGASSNNPADSLGLFGMGFNIATARLGRFTEVKSGKVGSTEWNIVQIDLDAMTSTDSFSAPVRTEPKGEHEHGTVISVSRLGSDIMDQLRSTRAVSTAVSKLGRIYTYMLRDPEALGISGGEVMGGLGLNLYLNGIAVDPVIPCIWDPGRSVAHEGADVPAVMPLNVPLADGHICMNCGHWHSLQVGTCSECGSDQIEVRERRVRGWIGIQRYLDTKDYGLTFFRNGRAILSQNKDYFSFTFDDDDLEEVEYPELREGRIVGEIHLDHVPVNVRKTDFDKSSSAWVDARRLVRGESPLRPQIAKRRGYRKNASPMGQLFSAYRRNDPGKRYLIPGDGEKALHNQARTWAERFRRGDRPYFTDDKWYEAVLQHERGPAPEPDAEETDDVAVLEQMGLGEIASPTADQGADQSQPKGAPTPESAPVETAEERIQRYITESSPIGSMTGQATIGYQSVELNCYLYEGPGMSTQDGGPDFVVNARASKINAFISAQHFLIQGYGWLPSDALMVLLSPPLANLYYRRQEESEKGKGQALVMKDILQSFPDLQMTPQTCRSRGEELVERLRDVFGTVTNEQPDLWSALSPASREEAESVARRTDASLDWSTAITNGDFGFYLTPLGMANMVQDRPEILLDGKVLSTSYAGWGEAARATALQRVAGLFNDLAALIELTQSADRRDLRRLSLSADILDSLVVD